MQQPQIWSVYLEGKDEEFNRFKSTPMRVFLEGYVVDGSDVAHLLTIYRASNYTTIWTICPESGKFSLGTEFTKRGCEEGSGVNERERQSES